MRQKSTGPQSPSERLVKDIRRATRKHYSAARLAAARSIFDIQAGTLIDKDWDLVVREESGIA